MQLVFIFFCSDSVIDKLCEQAKFIETVDDFPVELFGIRQEIKHTFFFYYLYHL